MTDLQTLNLPVARGRPRKFAEYEALLVGLPPVMTKRPRYLRGIGVFRGQRGETAWLKVRLTYGGTFHGRAYRPGAAVEIKLGNLASFSWDKLHELHAMYQGKADRREPLEELPVMLFRDWADRWIKRRSPGMRSKTDGMVLRTHLMARFGPRSLDSVSPGEVNEYVADRLKRARPGTVIRELNTLRAILSAAVKEGVIERNPCHYSDSVRGTGGRQRFLEGPELVTLLATAEHVVDWLPDFILWCVHSGMRKGEVKSLLWSDIRQLEDGRTLAMVRTSKDGRPRIVPCTRTMAEVLARQHKRQVKGDDRIFPITPMTLRRRWEAAREAAGLRDVTLHDLRRTHGTHAAAAGVDLRTLADRIGHADLTMLQKHYAAVVGTTASEAAETFQHAFDRMVTRKPAVASPT